MSELVERVARAMSEDRDGDTWDVKSEDGDGHGYMGKNDYRRLAEVAMMSIFTNTRATEFKGSIILANPDFAVHYWNGSAMKKIEPVPPAP